MSDVALSDGLKAKLQNHEYAVSYVEAQRETIRDLAREVDRLCAERDETRNKALCDAAAVLTEWCKKVRQKTGVVDEWQGAWEAILALRTYTATTPHTSPHPLKNKAET